MTIVICHVIHYNSRMIKTFVNKLTEEVFCTGQSKQLPADVLKRAVRKPDMIDAAVTVEDLRRPPGNRLHVLQGDRFGQYSIAINDQYRICFKFVGEDAYSVEICDYH